MGASVSISSCLFHEPEPARRFGGEPVLRRRVSASLRETRARAAVAESGLAAWFALAEVAPGSCRRPRLCASPRPSRRLVEPLSAALPRSAWKPRPVRWRLRCRPTALRPGRRLWSFPLLVQGLTRAAAPGAPPRTREGPGDPVPAGSAAAQRERRAGVVAAGLPASWAPGAAFSPLRVALRPQPHHRPPGRRPRGLLGRIPGADRGFSASALSLPRLLPDSPGRARSPGSAPWARPEPRSSRT